PAKAGDVPPKEFAAGRRISAELAGPPVLAVRLRYQSNVDRLAAPVLLALRRRAQLARDVRRQPTEFVAEHDVVAPEELARIDGHDPHQDGLPGQKRRKAQGDHG